MTSVFAIPAPDLLSALPNLQQTALAIGLIAAAWAVGIALRRLLGERLDAWLQPRLPSDLSDLRVAPVVQHAVAALLLAGLTQVPQFGVVRRLLVGLALGLAVALLVKAAARVVRVRPGIAVAVATVAGTAALFGAVGGLEPLLGALDRAAITVGTRRITALGVLTALLTAVVLFAAGRLVIRLVGGWIGRLGGLDPSQRLLAQKLAGIAVTAGFVLLGIDLLGIDLTALAVFSGAFGLAVGFGLQKTLGNLISGLILLMDRSIKPGDVIVVGDQFGHVRQIGIRAVSVLTRDGKEHLIPNEKLMTEPVENWSFSDRNVRVHIRVGVSYASDLPTAQRLMLQAATETRRVLADPAPNVWLRGFGDSTVDHDILVWISDPEEGVGNVQSAVLNRLWALFKEHDIELPYPQRDIHVRSLPEAARG